MNKYNFDKKIILITGAADGLGKELSFELSRRNSYLILIDKNYEGLKEVKKNLVNSSEIYDCNLKNLEKLNDILNVIKNKHKKIDCIFNNAAYELAGFVEELNFKDIVNQFNANFFSNILIIQKLFKNIENNNAKIINFSSDAGFKGVPTRSIYCSSKSAIFYFTDSLRQEFKHKDINVITVIPPKLDTKFFQNIEYQASLKEEPFIDKRSRYSAKKFAAEIILGIENGEIIITKKYKLVKLYIFLNFIFPKLGDFLLKKFSNFNDVFVKNDKN